MFVASYIQTATQIFNEYSLQFPLAVFLKKYFNKQTKFGSRDRKYISELLYGMYRLGPQPHLSVQERLLIGSFLSGALPTIFFEKTDKFFAEHYPLPFAEKKQLVIEKFQVAFSIPFPLSSGITEEEYIEYLFRPSRVFIRIRKNRDDILSTLTQKEVEYQTISDTCISFPQKIKIQELLPKMDEYVIQDYSSQLVQQFFQPKDAESWWDCCAASGGKSLLLLDKNARIDLTVSDIRSSIIDNLHERFRLYHYRKYKAFVIDLSKPIKQDFEFDKIIADVPCSGAGTWSRSAEQYYFFSEKKLLEFQQTQKAILTNALQRLKLGGSLYYFTCSIFKAENEDVISTVDQTQFQIVQQQLLKAFELGGDCLFFCEIKKL
jgi:16S rRNA (cytosine967-C5)-methyltransferase